MGLIRIGTRWDPIMQSPGRETAARQIGRKELRALGMIGVFVVFAGTPVAAQTLDEEIANVAAARPSRAEAMLLVACPSRNGARSATGDDRVPIRALTLAARSPRHLAGPPWAEGFAAHGGVAADGPVRPSPTAAAR